MAFAVENRDRFPNPEALQAATVNYLQSGQTIDDPEYGSFIVSFIIGPIIAFLIGRLVQWVWDNSTSESKDQLQNGAQATRRISSEETPPA